MSQKPEYMELPLGTTPEKILTTILKSKKTKRAQLCNSNSYRNRSLRSYKREVEDCKLRIQNCEVEIGKLEASAPDVSGLNKEIEEIESRLKSLKTQKIQTDPDKNYK